MLTFKAEGLYSMGLTLTRRRRKVERVKGESYLVKVDVVVKRYKEAQLGGPEPSDGVPANRQEDESHVELEGLGCAFSG